MESEDRIESEVELPFADRIDLEVFYDGPGRGEFLAQLLEAVDGGAPLMVLSGSEGSGKTAMCRVIERHCRQRLDVVFFATTVESFEDVIRRIVATLQVQLAETEENRGKDSAVEQIVSHLSLARRGLLLIFDQAEDIYLATLERIRKMLDRVTAAGACMQILFAGRKTFLENCEQLAICDFRNSEGVHIDLPPLAEEQSAAYLRCIAEKTLPPEKQRVFNDEVVRNIHALGKGRPGRLNLLARESLHSHGNDTSFMTLLDSIQEESSAGEVSEKPVRRLAKGGGYLRWVVGVGVIAVVGLLLLRPAEEVKLREPTAVKSGATVIESVNKAEEAIQPESQPAGETKQAGTEQPNAPIVEVSVAAVEQVQPKSQASEETEKVEHTASDAAPIPATMVEAVTERVAAVVEPSPVPPPVAEEAMPSKPSSKESIGGAAPSPKVLVLKAVTPIKVRPANWKPGQSDIAKPTAKSDGQDSTTLGIDQLFQKRMQAASSWAGNQKKEKFTVQLMVLTAKNAEANFKRMLAQGNYRQEAGNFFIFKRSGSPEVVWVFYGEYASLEQARMAQNSLPQFLRDHHPYAIGIRAAIGKVLAK